MKCSPNLGKSEFQRKIQAARLELARPKSAHFECAASTNSATPAWGFSFYTPNNVLSNNADNSHVIKIYRSLEI